MNAAEEALDELPDLVDRLVEMVAKHAGDDASAGAWRLAAVEVEGLVCAGCKRKVQPTKHTTCERMLRLARKFRGRAAAMPEPLRGPVTRVEELSHGHSGTA